MSENENITKLDYNGKEIYLVATAHVSKQSVELVKQVIGDIKPDSICIELDEERFHNMKHPHSWEDTDIIKVIKSKKVGFMIANLALSSYQKKIANKFGTVVGGEMLQGIESAENTGANLVLADRKIQTTFLRIWRKLGFIEKMKLLFSILFSFDDEDTEISDEDLANLLEEDMLSAVLADMKKEFPQIGEVLIHERDQYLAAKIKDAPGEKIVAILGGAHVPGVKNEIHRDQNLEEISIVPPPKKFSKLIGWVIPVIIIGLIIYAYTQNFATGMQQLSIWVIWNGALAALFTVFALGHPLSILTSFVVAPISSLNPFLACGWFAGIVEANVRRPTVKDFHHIQEDIFSVKGFFRNRILKILLVVIMANIGSTIGTFVAGMDIIRSLI